MSSSDTPGSSHQRGARERDEGGTTTEGDAAATANCLTPQPQQQQQKELYFVDEEICPLCIKKLPNSGRGIVPCGHTYCFECIFAHVKKDARCPACEAKVTRVTKVFRKAEAKVTRSNSSKRRRCRVKEPIPGVLTKKIRVRKPRKWPGATATTPRCLDLDKPRDSNGLRRQDHPQRPGLVPCICLGDIR